MSEQGSAANLRELAEAARDACLAVERDGGRSFLLLKRMDEAIERLQDELPADRVLALLEAAKVYVVMGHDEEYGWAVAAYTDKERAEACVDAYQAQADSELEFYRVKELKLNV